MFIHIVWVKEIGRVTLLYITKRLHYMKMGGLPISVLYSFADVEEIIFLLNLIKKSIIIPLQIQYQSNNPVYYSGNIEHKQKTGQSLQSTEQLQNCLNMAVMFFLMV